MKFSLNNSKQVAKYMKVLQQRVNYVKQKYAQTLWTNLYTTTPRKSGAAAASWNISLNSPDYTFSPTKTSNAYISIKCNMKDTLVVATGCPYMARLNYGWSKQAPANFIETCITISKNQIPNFTQQAQRTIN